MKVIAKLVIRFYKLFLVGWILLTLGLGYFALQLPGLLHGDGFETNGEFKKVEQELTETFGVPKSTILLLFEKKATEKNADFNRRISETLTSIQDKKITEKIQSPLSDDKLRKDKISYAVLAFDEEQDEMRDQVEHIRGIAGNDKHIKLTGPPVLNLDINQASQDDLKRAELIGLPFALLVLLFAFGSVAGSLVPIITGAITVMASFGVLTLLSANIPLSIFILNVVPMIGLALSIDFSLLFINRYREELHDSQHDVAIEKTIMTAGRSIIFSAVCVFIGLASMLVFQIDIFKTISAGGMVVVGIAVISSLSLLPSILLLLGDHINKWMLLKPKAGNENGWRKFASFVMRRPVIVSLAAFAVLLVSIIPVKDMTLAIPKADSLPKSYESRQAFEDIQKEFPESSRNTVYVLAKRDQGWKSAAGLEQLKKLEDEWNRDYRVQSISSVFTAANVKSAKELRMALENPQSQSALEPVTQSFIQDEMAMMQVHLKGNPSSEESKDFVREWSSKDFDAPVLVGGQAKFNQEIFDEIYNKIGIGVLIILLSTYFILLLAFRSLVIPLKAILMNTISLSATFGVLVWIFQYGHFGIPKSDITLIIPVIVFSLVFGLSMDYEVFLISRIHEIYLETRDNHFATVEGLSSTSKIITSAALIMIVITGAFAFTGVMPVKQIGIGIAIAIFIDATIVRMLLVPSLMKLLGDWNWWLPFTGAKKQARG
ncbi:MMPL family transporter [Peribacillus saganii]|uniref:MMPL family transporter n=1 Tax=Peribacillus saganii TaxID=2303992 RepID=A0A372LJ14_9BACI|nr:MMPL family transporter [Peribacillus saganii]RFU66372.1 MMPL family transporter [Peribacillus saganii]